MMELSNHEMGNYLYLTSGIVNLNLTNERPIGAERSRSIDIRIIMRDLQTFQIDMFRKFEILEKSMEDGLIFIELRVIWTRCKV
jgi:hypothetical protein